MEKFKNLGVYYLVQKKTFASGRGEVRSTKKMVEINKESPSSSRATKLVERERL